MPTLRMRKSLRDLKRYFVDIITPQARVKTIAWIPTDPDSEGEYGFDWKGFAAGSPRECDHNTNPLWLLRNTGPSTRFTGGPTSYQSFNTDRHVTVLAFGDVFATGFDPMAVPAAGPETPTSVSLYQLIHTYAPKRASGLHGHCIVAVAIEPAEGGDAELDDWYCNEHLDLLAKVPIYVRTTRYKLLRPAGPALQSHPPSHLALHEYSSSKELLDYALQHGPLAPETERSKRVLGGAKHVERTVWDIVVP